MRNRWPILLLAGVLFAQGDAPAKKEPPTAFDAPPPGTWGGPGVRARYAESLARAKARLDRNAGDADALEKSLDLCDQLGRTLLLIDHARKAVAAEGIDEQARLRNRGVLGICLVQQANSMGSRGFVWNFGANGQVTKTARVISDPQKKIYNEAIEHLRAAIKGDRSRPNLRHSLADALESLTKDGESVEADKLRTEAAVIASRSATSPVAIGAYAKLADELIVQAAELEQKAEHPDHVRALELRKRALVLTFCRDTIPFDYTASLYVPVSLLADSNLVVPFLTRTYTNRKGDTAQVAPNFHGATYARRAALIEALGKEKTSGADAVLLALVRGANVARHPVAEKAMATLAQEGHKSAYAGLPLVLAKALHARDANRFPQQGQRMLVELAVRMQVKEAARGRAAALDRDTDLRWPRGIAVALGRLGSAEHAQALIVIARNAQRDIHFRREAARGAMLLDPERAAPLAENADLAIAIAAARFERAPDDDSKGRILNGIEDTLEVDEAARYCAELGIAEARPALEKFLREHGTKRDHPAKPAVEDALRRLSAAN